MFKNSHTPKSESDTETDSDSDQPSDPDRALSDQSNNYKTRHKSLGGKPFKKGTKLKTLDKGAYLGSKANFDDSMPSLMNLSQGHANFSKIDVNNQHSGHENVIAPLAKIQKEGVYESFTDAHAGNNKDIIHGNILQNKGGINFANLDFIAIKGANILSSLPLPKGRTEFSGFSSNNNNSINVEPKEELIMPQKAERLKSLSETQPGYNGEGESEGEGDETAGEVSPKGAVQSVGDESNNNPVEGLVQDEFKDVPEKASDEKRLAESILESQADLEPGRVVEVQASMMQAKMAINEATESDQVEALNEENRVIQVAASRAEVIEVSNIFEAAEAKIPEEAQQGQEGGELMLFAQDEQQLNNHEEPMSKLPPLSSIPESPKHISESPRSRELQSKTDAQIKLDAKIKKVFELIAEGESRINTSEINGMIIFGKTDSGKSTLANMLAGRKLSARQEEGLAGKWIITPNGERYEGAAAASGRDSPIGNNRRSETTIPYNFKIKDENTIIWDTPGIGDDRGFEQEVANGYYIQRLIDNTANLKFLLTTTQASLIDENGEGLIKVASHFAKTFKNIDRIKESISLVVTKAGARTTSAGIKSEIAKILAENQKLQNPEKGSDEELVIKVLQYLQSSIKVFHEPTKEGVMLKAELTLRDFDSLKFSSSNKDIVPSIPEEIALDSAASVSSGLPAADIVKGNHAVLLNEYRDEAKAILEQVVLNISILNDIIAEFFSQQALNPHASVISNITPNQFSERFEGSVKEWLPKSFYQDKDDIGDEYIQNIFKEGDFVKLNQLLLMKQILTTESQDQKADMEKMVKVLKLLKKFVAEIKFTSCPENCSGLEQKQDIQDISHDQNLSLSDKIEGYIHILRQQMVYKEFFEDLCDVPHANPLASTVRECGIQVQKILNDSIRMITLEDMKATKYHDPNSEIAYLKNALNWLEKYSGYEGGVIKTKASINYVIGKLHVEQKDDEEGAISYYEQAIVLNPAMREAHLDLGNIHLNKAKVFEKSAVRQKESGHKTQSKDSAGQAEEHLLHALKCFQKADSSHYVDLCFERLLKNSPEKLSMLLTMKGDYYAKYDPSEARKCYVSAQREAKEGSRELEELNKKIVATVKLCESSKPFSSLAFYKGLIENPDYNPDALSAASLIPETIEPIMPVMGADGAAAAAAFQ